MGADIRTVEEVDIGRFRVAVGEAGTDQFEAAVVNVELDNLALDTSPFDLSRVTSLDEVPLAAAGKKYTAIGQAVDAFVEYASEGDSSKAEAEEAGHD